MTNTGWVLRYSGTWYYRDKKTIDDRLCAAKVFPSKEEVENLIADLSKKRLFRRRRISPSWQPEIVCVEIQEVSEPEAD